MFPRAVMNRFPLLSLEEEGRLNDMPLRENFIERVFRSPERSDGASYRWTEMLKKELSSPAHTPVSDLSTGYSGSPGSQECFPPLAGLPSAAACGTIE
jgi:hypothetical protein